MESNRSPRVTRVGVSVSCVRELHGCVRHTRGIGEKSNSTVNSVKAFQQRLNVTGKQLRRIGNGTLSPLDLLPER